jgi:hypothetical protein
MVVNTSLPAELEARFDGVVSLMLAELSEPGANYETVAEILDQYQVEDREDMLTGLATVGIIMHIRTMLAHAKEGP